MIHSDFSKRCSLKKKKDKIVKRCKRLSMNCYHNLTFDKRLIRHVLNMSHTIIDFPDIGQIFNSI